MSAHNCTTTTPWFALLVADIGPSSLNNLLVLFCCDVCTVAILHIGAALKRKLCILVPYFIAFEQAMRPKGGKSPTAVGWCLLVLATLAAECWILVLLVIEYVHTGRWVDHGFRNLVLPTAKPEDECVVCYCPLGRRNMVVVAMQPCGHVYHWQCIRPAFGDPLFAICWSCNVHRRGMPYVFINVARLKRSRNRRHWTRNQPTSVSHLIE